MLESSIAWLAASLVAYAVATNAAWHVIETAPRLLPSVAVRRAAAWLYFAGVPVAALAMRVPASPAHLGLAWPQHPLPAVGASLAIGLVLAGVLRAAPAAAPLAALRPWPIRLPDARLAALAAAESVALALHVAFVRSVVLASGVGLGLGDGPAGGATTMVATLALLGLEALLSPWTRHAVFAASPPPAAIVRGAGLATADAAAFALTGSLATALVARLAASAWWLIAAEPARLDDAAEDGSSGAVADRVEPIEALTGEMVVEPTIF